MIGYLPLGEKIIYSESSILNRQIFVCQCAAALIALQQKNDNFEFKKIKLDILHLTFCYNMTAFQCNTGIIIDLVYDLLFLPNR